MLISLTGSQSSGKSTLLGRMAIEWPQWEYIPEVTRRIKRVFDLPINEQGSEVVQMLIMGDHLINAFSKPKFENTVLDRCSLDGLVYTHWLCDNMGLPMGVYNYAYLAYEKTIEKYDYIFYTDPADVLLVDDGERSINVEFRDQIIELFDKYKSNLSNVITVSGTIEERLQKIKEILKK